MLPSDIANAIKAIQSNPNPDPRAVVVEQVALINAFLACQGSSTAVHAR